MALGTIVLGGVAAGVAIWVGGIVILISSRGIKKQANSVAEEIKEAEYKLVKIMAHLHELELVSAQYKRVLQQLDTLYQQHLKKLEQIVDVYQKRNWNIFTDREKKATENTVLLVSLLYQFCKTPLVTRSQLLTDDGAYDISTINKQELKNNIGTAEYSLKGM